MKLLKKYELPLTTITLITFAILLIMSFYNGSFVLTGTLSLCFIFTLIDVIAHIKKK